MNYSSGINRPGLAWRLMQGGVPLGCVAGELSRRMRGALAHYASIGGRVFIDSGAFSACGMLAGGFEAVLDLYAEMARDCEQPSNLRVVAPDVVGDQQATLRVLRRHRRQLAELHELGVEIVIGIQRGALSGPFLLASMRRAAGVPFVAGIPSNKAAWTEAELVEFASSLPQDQAIHLLGGGRAMTARASAVLRRRVDGDSVEIRKVVGKRGKLARWIEFYSDCQDPKLARSCAWNMLLGRGLFDRDVDVARRVMQSPPLPRNATEQAHRQASDRRVCQGLPRFQVFDPRLPAARPAAGRLASHSDRWRILRRRSTQ